MFLSGQNPPNVFPFFVLQFPAILFFFFFFYQREIMKGPNFYIYIAFISSSQQFSLSKALSPFL